MHNRECNASEERGRGSYPLPFPGPGHRRFSSRAEHRLHPHPSAFSSRLSHLHINEDRRTRNPCVVVLSCSVFLFSFLFRGTGRRVRLNSWRMSLRFSSLRFSRFRLRARKPARSDIAILVRNSYSLQSTERSSCCRSSSAMSDPIERMLEAQRLLAFALCMSAASRASCRIAGGCFEDSAQFTHVLQAFLHILQAPPTALVCSRHAFSDFLMYPYCRIKLQVAASRAQRN